MYYYVLLCKIAHHHWWRQTVAFQLHACWIGFVIKALHFLFSSNLRKGFPKKSAVLLDSVQMRGERALPNFLSTFHKLYILGQLADLIQLLGNRKWKWPYTTQNSKDLDYMDSVKRSFSYRHNRQWTLWASDLSLKSAFLEDDDITGTKFGKDDGIDCGSIDVWVRLRKNTVFPFHLASFRPWKDISPSLGSIWGWGGRARPLGPAQIFWHIGVLKKWYKLSKIGEGGALWANRLSN